MPFDKEEIRRNRGRFNVQDAIDAQTDYVNHNGYPYFARTFAVRGNCYRCGKNIYQKYGSSGYDVAYAMSNLVTGCPHCHKSYCD